MDDENSNKERQAAELTLLETMYPTEFAWRSNPPPDLTRSDFADPVFALTLHPSFTLEFTLPKTYPSTDKPSVYLSCGETIPTSTRKQSRAALASIIADQPSDTEIPDLITTSFLDILSKFTSNDDDDDDQENKHTDSDPSATNPSNSTSPQRTKQVTIWSHHLLSTTKRKQITSWSRELSLHGYSRPGHPGAVFAEGPEDGIDEFIARLKALRWQALQVRSECSVERSMFCSRGDGGAAGTSEGVGIVEMQSLGEIVEALRKRDEGVAAGFLEAMKIASSSSSSS
ncbi:hypothetical protein AAFC00_003602 [Neodothiora populina]|uniref:RWD domain-containing protein n=1 Tax=Neodothiora populina TaxID=2781224 RepID=A0ABR3PER0_9PEZI